MFWPLCTLESFLSMHQFRHLCGQSFMCKAFTWILSLLLHHPLHLRQREEGEQLQEPAKRPQNISHSPITVHTMAKFTVDSSTTTFMESFQILHRYLISITKSNHQASSSPTLPHWRPAAWERTGRVQRETSCLCWATLRCLPSSPACPRQSWSPVEWSGRTPPRRSLCRGIRIYWPSIACV